jgi:hypothetical protein
VTAERPADARPLVEHRVARFAFFATVVVGALSAFVLIVATEPPRRTPGSLGGAFVAAVLYSAFFTVPGGVLAGAVAKRIARGRRGRHGLGEWLLAGASWGGLAGAACFLVPLLLSALLAGSPGDAITTVVVALTGAVPGALTGAIVALYCRNLQARR